MQYEFRNLMLLLGLIIPLFASGDADAQFEGALRGDYSMALHRTCASAGTIDSNFVPSGTSFVADIQIKGNINYNGTGGGSFTGESLMVVPGAPPNPTVDRATQTCTVTYSVNADGTLTQTMNCNLTFAVGGPPPAPGQTATLNGIVLNGQLSQDGTVLVIGDTTPNVETYTITSGTQSGGGSQRVCNGNGTATSRR